MPTTKRRKRANPTKISKKSKRKVNTGLKRSKDVVNTVNQIEQVMTRILDARFKMMDSLFKTTKPPEEWDYSEFEPDDFDYEFQIRPGLAEEYPNYKTFSIDKKETILKADDSVEETKEKLVKIDRLIKNFKKSLKDMNTDITIFLLENEPKRTSGLINFIDEFKYLPQQIDYNNMVQFHSFMLRMFMNPFNWLEDDVNFDKRYKKNLLWILNKSEDYTINYISILNKYNEIFEIENIKVNERYSDSILTTNTKKKVISQFGEIGNDILAKLQITFVQNFSGNIYNTQLPNIGITFKEFVEQDLIKSDSNTISTYDDFFINNPLNKLTLDKSHTIKYRSIKAIKPPDLNTYFGIGKSGRELKKGFEAKYTDTYNEFPPEHRLYLFFKEILKMRWYPNPTSKPEHEIEIRSYLQQFGFIGPKPNVDEDKKNRWYADQTLKVGEFVEQPNGGTAHPDLWVQLSNLRLSIEAKSNQGYYPMYGNTPPPKETVYIFSSKKTKYPNASKPTGKIRQKGRTTFTFGHHLLTDNIRDIMRKSKQEINLVGKKLDSDINKTKENFSTVGLSANTNILHMGKDSNYWLNDRNLFRERQVLFYNWLEPEGKCDQSVKNYICENRKIFGTTQTTTFECKGTRRPKSGCECITHKEDFEQKDSFVDKTFSQLENEVYLDSFYYQEINNGKYICHMCLMKYYTMIRYEFYAIEEIKDLVLLKDENENYEIFYNIVWKNYNTNSWLSEKNIINDSNFDNRELIKDFWENITVYRPNLDVPVWTGKITTSPNKNILVNGKNVFNYKDEDLMLVARSGSVKEDIFNYDRLVDYIEAYNKYVYNIYKS